MARWAMMGLLLLAGCGGSEPAAPPPSGPDVRAALRSMPAAQRDAVFIRAIRDAGQDCQKVTAAHYQREIGDRSLWAAVCDGGSAWAVYVDRSGGAQVAACGKDADGQPTCGAAG